MLPRRELPRVKYLCLNVASSMPSFESVVDIENSYELEMISADPSEVAGAGVTDLVVAAKSSLEPIFRIAKVETIFAEKRARDVSQK